MKIIVSHDVDHITAWEPGKSLQLVKHIVRSMIERWEGHVTSSEVSNRFRQIGRNNWHNLDSLTEFDLRNNVPGTFFFGVSNGSGLYYPIDKAKFWIKEMHSAGFDIGVHGISYDDHERIKTEYTAFKRLSGSDRFGIRMHYLRSNENTLQLLDRTGYMFDSSVLTMRDPYKVGELWEFPLHIMDGHIFCKRSRWQNQRLAQAKDSTKRIIGEALTGGLKYLTVLFHDRYFSESFKTLRDWYVWLISYLVGNGFEFISYHNAVIELESENPEPSSALMQSRDCRLV